LIAINPRRRNPLKIISKAPASRKEAGTQPQEIASAPARSSILDQPV